MQHLTKQQLIDLAMCDKTILDERYEAARELQYRHIPEDTRADVLYRIGKGESFENVAYECGLTKFQVIDLMRQMHRTHKSESDWKIGYKKTLKECGRRVHESTREKNTV